MRDVAKQMLDLFLETRDGVLHRNRPSKLRRTKKRIKEKLVALKKLNQEIRDYMIHMDVSCNKVANFNFRSESDMDVYKEARQKQEVKKTPEVETKVVALQNAKLPKLQINAYAGESLRWREFWNHSKTISIGSFFGSHNKILLPARTTDWKGICGHQRAVPIG